MALKINWINLGMGLPIGGRWSVGAAAADGDATSFQSALYSLQSLVLIWKPRAKFDKDTL